MTSIAEIDPISVVIAAVFLVAFVALLLKKNGTYNGNRCPACFPALPIVGSLPFMTGGLGALPKTFLKMTKKLGPVFSFYSGSNYVVVLNGKSIFDALVKKGQIFADRPVIWSDVNILNKDRRGIGYAPYNDAFKKYHKIFLSIMKEFGFGITQESDIRIWDEVERLIESIRDHNGQPFDPRKTILHSTANVLMTIFFGKEFQKQGHHIQQIIKNANKWAENNDPLVDFLPFLSFLPGYSRMMAASRKAQEELFACLDEGIKHSKTKNSSDDSFVRRFLEIMGQEYNHQDFMFILRDVCGGSSDTVVETMLWLLLEMANNTHIQARIQKELDAVVPSTRLPSYDDRLSLPYTEATTLECARFHTIAPFGILHQASTETEIGGYFIPKCMIIPNFYGVHMDPEIWTDPENFRPERFLDKDNKIIGKEKVIAFGVGKRSCIGEVLARQEVFVFFSSLLQHFEVRPPDGDDVIRVTDEFKLIVGPSPFQLRFIPRKNVLTECSQSENK